MLSCLFFISPLGSLTMLATGPLLTNTFERAEKSTRRPKLSDVLNGSSPAPWTSQAFKKFLDDRFCSEVLDFTVDVNTYCKYYGTSLKYNELQTRNDKSAAICQLWNQLLSKYIKVGAPQEINISGGARQRLLAYYNVSEPPPPAVLTPVYDTMHDFLADIFIEFVSSPSAK